MFKNAKILEFDTWGSFFNGTPAAAWFQRVELIREKCSVIQLSDALRYAIIFKHGGIYMDTDIITLKVCQFVIRALGLGQGLGFVLRACTVLLSTILVLL